MCVCDKTVNKNRLQLEMLLSTKVLTVVAELLTWAEKNRWKILIEIIDIKTNQVSFMCKSSHQFRRRVTGSNFELYFPNEFQFQSHQPKAAG